jgi:glutaredoxin 3
MGACNSYLKNEIKNNPVVIYSASYCPYCTSAKETFKKLNVDVFVVETDLVENGEKTKKYLEQMTGQKTIPNIFIAGNHVGGNSDLQEGLKNGSIQKILRDANITFTEIEA